jgi:HD-GYP domain-containing protein (c-di-GMP phosphodiesterase class II)/GAF domain-containing protein
MTTELAQKLEGVRDFRKILETTVKEIGETYGADVTQIVLSNPLDRNITSICEYKLFPEAGEDGELPVTTFPLPLEGPGLGSIMLGRKDEFHENELNWIRITLAELNDIIRHAQINDVVQRETFRDTFLVEIGNTFNTMPGIGDALFMVVNILGSVLKVSRCLFICVDDTQRGWKCYEYWQRDRVQSCKDYGWPTTDSPIIARSLLSESPLVVWEANENSYFTPVQEELAILGVRSLLGVPLRSESAVHGCIILQQCDSRHAWTRSEIDMVQNAADKVAEALAKLPDEKRAREPIMRLHQREVIEAEGNKESILAVRKALRATMGVSIPTAQKTTGAAPQGVSQAPPLAAPTPSPIPPAPQSAQVPPPAVAPSPPPQVAQPKVDSTWSDSGAEGDKADPWGVNQHLAGIEANPLTQFDNTAAPPPAVAPFSQQSSPPSDYAGFDTTPSPHDPSALSPLIRSVQAQSSPKPGGAEPPPQAQYSLAELDAIGASPASTGGATKSGTSTWGNLDEIPTPAGGPARSGLSGAMFGKKSQGGVSSSPLLASLHRDKSKFAGEPVEFIDGGTLQIDEAQAQAKLDKILSTSNPTSDYIFATPGLDARMLGRIDGWVTQVEEKDKYEAGHAVPVSEIAVAVASFLGLPQDEVDTIRQAAIVHDVGKLGLPAQLLKKSEDELSDSELLMIMKHPIDGANLLEGLPELKHLAPIVLAHHEEYNGNGYPAGLAGENIPLAARIIHVASSYHTMLTGNRNRAGMTDNEAQQALRLGAGSSFDPAVVEALIACLQQGSVAAV